MSKARLADKLLQSIRDKTDPDIEQAWIQEIQRKKETLKSGDASLHSVPEVIKETKQCIRE